jgi:hypothetical protein
MSAVNKSRKPAPIQPTGPFVHLPEMGKIAADYIEQIGDRVTNSAAGIVFLATDEIEEVNP